MDEPPLRSPRNKLKIYQHRMTFTNETLLLYSRLWRGNSSVPGPNSAIQIYLAIPGPCYHLRNFFVSLFHLRLFIYLWPPRQFMNVFFSFPCTSLFDLRFKYLKVTNLCIWTIFFGPVNLPVQCTLFIYLWPSSAIMNMFFCMFPVGLRFLATCDFLV